ncbi:MAG: hypothetical protein AAFP03_09225 [Cyanobacteria bacterium J06598_3]
MYRFLGDYGLVSGLVGRIDRCDWLAVTMGVARSTVNQWVNEVSDPLADSIPEIINALEELEPSAAQIFLQLYIQRNGSRRG